MKTWRRYLIFIALLAVFALLGAACGDGDSADNTHVEDDGHSHAADELDAKAVEGASLVNGSEFVGKEAAEQPNNPGPAQVTLGDGPAGDSGQPVHRPRRGNKSDR